jgi:hypothetical protein
VGQAVAVWGLRSGRERRGEVRLKITLTCGPHVSVVEKREERITDRIWRGILVFSRRKGIKDGSKSVKYVQNGTSQTNIEL